MTILPFENYKNSDLIKLFQRETGGKVDDIFVEEFRRWLAVQNPRSYMKMLPFDYHLWVIQKAHEYYNRECCCR